ncbi:MAG: tRNA uridine-5-carboxymethylaminomethyl(34) synthesis GTPase MnmE [Candidatus Aerophobetes bacterium]|nr:tRNA uridine-5-carboxymethylaminomethyl(34) synthesis GTPase MnmE [Candidatus Aerophobetes bacterium]
MSLNDTIAAIATPLGYSGIGIVRMSGDQSLPIARRIFQPWQRKKIDWKSSFTIHYGWIINPETGEDVDEVLLTLMRAPKTYTREDIVEINCHGGPVPLRKILNLTLRWGACLAEPGEFTKRAFLNGRIDLMQAEGVLDIVQAKTEKGLEAALNQLEGKLSKKINSLEEEIINLLSDFEAEIDFAYEDIKFLSPKEAKKHLHKILIDINCLLEMNQLDKIYREGIKLVIAGKPNVGKSTLLNALLQRKRAIVTPTPGTTRDTIEEVVNIKGFPLRIIDTAGLKKAGNKIEKEALKQTYSKLEEADIILLMLDGSVPLNGEDNWLYEKIKKEKTLALINKIDLPQRINKEKISPLFSKEKRIEISAKEETNLQKLIEKLANLMLNQVIPTSNSRIAVNLRQKKILEKVRKNIRRALQGVEKKRDKELVSFELREGLKRLGEITGKQINEEILNNIFSRFCIGK